MTSKPVSLFTSAAVGSVSTPLYSVPSGTTTVLKNISFFNRSSDNVLVQLYVVPEGRSADDDTLAFERTLGAKETVIARELFNDAVSDGTRIEAKASADSAINANGSGTEVK